MFGTFLAIFPDYGAKIFFQNIRLCHAQLDMGFQHYAKIQKKLMIQFQENAWTIVWTEDPILQDPSGQGNEKKKF